MSRADPDPLHYPSRVELHDTWLPDDFGYYSQIGPKSRYSVTLGLRAVRPRVVRVVFLDLSNWDLAISVEKAPLTVIKAGTHGGWVAQEFTLPPSAPDTFTLEFTTPGNESAALKEVAVAYAGD